MTEEKLYNPPDYLKYLKSAAYEEALLMAEQNSNSALMWKLLHDAHNDGDPRASYAIAASYLHTQPPVVKRKNFKKAINYLQPALKAHIPFAFYNFAICLELGQGTEKNEETAFHYYLLALNGGCQEAVGDVSRCYHHGIGVRKNVLLSKIWSMKS